MTNEEKLESILDASVNGIESLTLALAKCAATIQSLRAALEEIAEGDKKQGRLFKINRLQAAQIARKALFTTK